MSSRQPALHRLNIQDNAHIMNSPYSNPDVKTTTAIPTASDATDAFGAARVHAGIAMDKMARSAEDLRRDVEPVLDQASEQIGDLAHRGADAVRRAAQQLRDGADRASTRTVDYIKDEPLKALLMAAAAGAVLAAVVSLASQARRRY